jgi:hypothetical protein
MKSPHAISIHSTAYGSHVWSLPTLIQYVSPRPSNASCG